VAFLQEAAWWLADHLGTEVESVPGAHGPQFSDPSALVTTIRAFAASV